MEPANFKEENFKRITSKRSEKIIEMISSFSNLTNTSFYDFTEDDIEEMFSKIQDELNKQHDRLIAFSKSPRRVKL